MEQSPWDPEGVEPRLDHDGRLVDASRQPDIDLRSVYKRLVAARALDLRVSRLGLPLWASAAGEEAVAVAVARLAAAHDRIFTAGRDASIALARDVPLEEIARQLLRHPDAVVRPATLPGHVASRAHGIEPAVPSLGHHVAVAAGYAHAQRLTGEGVTLATFGEGLTTTGPYHEACAVAAAAELPLVLVCRSQLWPETAPAEAGVLGDSVFERARAMGLWARRIDGADVVSVWETLAAAMARARKGMGPALVEAVVTPLHRDPPAHRDPVERLRRHLDATGAWTQTFQDVIEAEFRGAIEPILESLLRDLDQRAEATGGAA